MDSQILLPTLDNEVLQKKVNDAAMAGAFKSIEEYYTGYNSPYRKAIDEALKTKSIDSMFDLPDIIGTINDSLGKQIDILANGAIAKIFTPMVKRFLTRIDREIKFSDVLKHFVKETDQEDFEECEVSVKEDGKYGWLNIEISGADKQYEFTLHLDHETKNEPVKKYQLLSLPTNYSKGASEKMKILIENATIEIPFTRDILADKFTSYLARVIICDCKITMDTDNFHEDMFPERCHC